MNSTYSTYSFPPQKLSKGKKDTSWKESCVDAIIAREGSGQLTGGRTRKERMFVNYELYNGEFNEEDLRHVTNPYKVDDGFPATPQDINIVRPKIDILIGEESKRPRNINVIQTNESVITDLLEKKSKLIRDFTMAQINEELGGSPNEQMNPNQIDRYLKEDMKTIAERSAMDIINYYWERLNIPNELLKGFKDGLIAGETIWYNGIVNGEPLFERCNPLACDYDQNSDFEFIEDRDWFLRRFEMTPASIYDRFYDIMDESDLDKVLALTEGIGSAKGTPGSSALDSPFKSIMYKQKMSNKFMGEDYSTMTLSVWHCVWRSFKKIGFLTTYDDSGEESITMVDETYKPLKGEEIEWDWIVEIWEGYRIDDDIYVGINPVDYQSTSLDNPNAGKLPYCGVVYSNTNTRSKSLIEIMKPLQYMYIVLWYRLELALARDKGKVIIMDPTQIPKSMGIDTNRWLHMLSSVGVMFVNPYEEGWDTPGRDGGKPASFNQFAAQDLSMTSVIVEYIELMNKIEDMVGELSGVSKQRQGSIETRELVGNVERAVIQSSHITEPIFWLHNQGKKNALRNFLNTAKHAIENSGKQYVHYFTDDLTRNFFKITDDFLYADLDVFLGDSTKDYRNIEAIRSLLQPAMQNGATLLDVAFILTTDNLTEIKNRLEDIEEKKQQREEEMARIQQEAQQRQIQMETQLRSEELRVREEESVRQSQTAIEVALINAEQSGDETKDNSFQQELERERLSLEKKRQLQESEMKKSQLRETIRSNKAAEQEKVRTNKVNETIRRKAASRRPAGNK
jgi:hypothetical protein